MKRARSLPRDQAKIPAIVRFLLATSFAFLCAVLLLISFLPPVPKPADRHASAVADDAGGVVNALFNLADKQRAPFILPCADRDSTCERDHNEFGADYLAAITGYGPAQVKVAQYLAPGSNNPGIKSDAIEACAWAILGMRSAPPGLVDTICLTDANAETMVAAKARVVELQRLILAPLSPE